MVGEEEWNYGETIFWRNSLEINQFNQVIENIRSRKPLFNRNYIHIDDAGYFRKHILSSSNPLSENPGIFITLGSSSNYGIQLPILYDLPYFSRSEYAVARWFGIPYEDFNRFLNYPLSLFLPECRSRLKDIKIEKLNLSGKIIKRAGAEHKSLRIKLGVRSYDSANIYEFIDYPVVTDEISIQIPMDSQANMLGIEIFLIDEENYIYDYWSNSGLINLHDESQESQGNNEKVLAAIDSGEGENIEFKPYIQLGDKTKSKELLETVEVGADKPYLISDTNELLIRKGANNRKPNEKELNELTSRREWFEEPGLDI
jgi:hypothetical protein